jgi:hypothetical protein
MYKTLCTSHQMFFDLQTLQSMRNHNMPWSISCLLKSVFVTDTVVAAVREVTTLRTERRLIEWNPLTTVGSVRVYNNGQKDMWDARRCNLVIMNISTALYSYEEAEDLLGEWERSYMVSYVRSRVDCTPAHPPNKHHLSLSVCKPWTMAPDGRPELALWAAVTMASRKGEKPPSSNWEDAKKLPWLEIKALPLSTYNRCYHSGTARALRVSARTEDFVNGEHPSHCYQEVYRRHLCK